MHSTTTARVAGNVRAEMGRKSVTQAQLAAALGSTQSAVSRRLLGKIPFNVEELSAVADVLDIPVSRLTDGMGAEAGVA